MIYKKLDYISDLKKFTDNIPKHWRVLVEDIETGALYDITQCYKCDKNRNTLILTVKRR